MARTPSRRVSLSLIAAAVFLLWFSQYLYLPTLPEYLRLRTGSLASVGGVLAMYGLWQLIVRLPLGVAVDALGRRRLFISAGFLLSAAGPLVLAFAAGVPALAIGRSLAGAAMGTWVPLVVVFSAFFPAEEALKASSLLTLVSALSRIAATALSGLLDRWGGYTLAFVLAAAAATAALLFLLPVPMGRAAAGGKAAPRPRGRKAPARPGEPPRLAELLRLAGHRDVLLPSLMGALNQYMVFGISLGFLPLLAGRVGGSQILIGLTVSANLVAFTVGTLLAAALSRRVYPSLGATYLLFAAACVGAALAGRPWQLFLLQAFMGLAHGVGYPTLMGLSIQRVSSKARTTAMGLHQSIYAAGIFAGPWACGLAAGWLGIRLMFAVTAAGVLLLGVFLTWTLGRRRPAAARQASTREAGSP